MKLFKKGNTILIDHAGLQYVTERNWDDLINRANLFKHLLAELSSFTRISEIDLQQPFDPPMQSQEIWAAGVTYFRSMQARMDESKEAGGGSFYDKVYQAERPELFFKSLAHRTVGHKGKIRIRRDSNWNVPEPELTLFMSSGGSIEGYTIGNDVSSRSIEGENPLYLPQAKTYQFSAALGPCLLVRELPLPADTCIHLQINRQKIPVFQQNIQISQMKRKHEELASWLFRETLFPHGTYLMTGTGIIPPDAFSLQPADEVIIRIDGIGELSNITSQRNLV
jgi:2-dehydro-3-deoxy-D-arabinonate dehydratase